MEAVKTDHPPIDHIPHPIENKDLSKIIKIGNQLIIYWRVKIISSAIAATNTACSERTSFQITKIDITYQI